MTGRVLRWRRITREDVQAHKTKMFIFGDNMTFKGSAGQAAAMRGEPNALGIPTKWKPGNNPEDYFTDEVRDNGAVMSRLIGVFEAMQTALHMGYDVVVPAQMFGTGYAQLPARAPQLFAWMCEKMAELEKPE